MYISLIQSVHHLNIYFDRSRWFGEKKKAILILSQRKIKATALEKITIKVQSRIVNYFHNRIVGNDCTFTTHLAFDAISTIRTRNIVTLQRQISLVIHSFWYGGTIFLTVHSPGGLAKDNESTEQKCTYPRQGVQLAQPRVQQALRAVAVGLHLVGLHGLQHA